ncbi:MAG TPA: MOSC domain-containing protein [Gaiellaceae bacterium]|nr:MOSC domain-containing protein [Gaiellaceae bacterium]
MSTDLRATREQLDMHLEELRALPTDRGTLELIVRRPREGERETPDSAEVTLDDGLVGDRWEPFVEADGSLGREAQLTIASTHLLGLIAEPERWALAGDNLLVDMGLDMESLPAGSRLAIGKSLVVQISELPHTGCAKFSARFGSDALKFINSPEGRRLRLRGVNAKVIVPGTISVGDPVRRVAA